MKERGSTVRQDPPRINFDQLRNERRARVLAAMADHELDTLLIGREANARYVTDARRLWHAGTKSFTPGCVILRANQEVYVLSNADDGIPVEIPRDHLFGRSWDPRSLVGTLQRFGRFGESRRIGVDSITPTWRRLLTEAAPHANIVDAQSLMRTVRMRKTEDEILCLRRAVAIAEAAMTSASEAIRPGSTERELLAAFMERMTEFGVTTPATEGPFVVLREDANVDTSISRRLPRDRVLASGDLVTLRGGVLYAGYEGALGRTWLCRELGSADPSGIGDLYDHWYEVWSHVRDACHPGSTGAHLRAAYESAGERLPGHTFAHSVGIGVEAPVAGSTVGAGFDARWSFEPGMVLAIEVSVGSGAHGYFGLETILITPSGHEVLSTLAHGPLAHSR